MICEIPKDTEVLQIDITELKKQIRADAIDDFAEKMKYEYGSDEIHETIDEIAEQLKAEGRREK